MMPQKGEIPAALMGCYCKKEQPQIEDGSLNGNDSEIMQSCKILIDILIAAGQTS